MDTINKQKKQNIHLILERLEPRILLSGYGDDYGDYTWESAYISDNNDSYSGYLGDYGFDKDMFNFYAVGGATYGFSVSGYDSLDSIQLTLIDKNGYSVIGTESSYYSGYSAGFGWTAPSSGYYYLEVKSPFYDTGYYGLGIAEESLPTDDYGDTPYEATYIQKNTGYYGTIEESLDTDCFGFYAYEGYEYSLETTTGTLTDTFLWLQDSYGNNITGDDNSGAGYGSNITWTASNSGYYYAAVQPSYNGIDSDFTGSYFIKVNEYYNPPVETIMPINIGSVIIDELDDVNDIDYFSFNAIAGHEYNIRAASEGIWGEETTDTVIALFAQDGNTLIDSDDDSGLGFSSQISWTAPSNGEYYLAIYPYQDEAFAGGSYSLSVSDGIADWTFMVYIAGDNDLEPFVASDINEIIDGIFTGAENLEEYTTNTNIVLQVDGYEGAWYDDSNQYVTYDYWDDSTWRYVLNPSFFGADIGEKNMGDPTVLSDFLNWSAMSYPADNYGLVLWNHGGGYPGVCWDDTNNYDYLSMSELDSAFNQTDYDLDLLGFDACLMSMVEVAYQFRNHADVFVASETLEPGDGWKYDEITYAMIDTPSITPDELASQIVSAYSHEYEGYYLQSELVTTLAAFDLENFEYLKNAIDELATTYLNSAYMSDWESLQNARLGPIQMGDYGSSSANYCELQLLMQRIIDNGVNTIIEEKVNNVLSVLSELTISEWHDTNLQGVGGISIYMPLVGEAIDPTYNANNLAFLEDTQWDEFLEVYVSGDFPINYSNNINIPVKGLTYTDADGSMVSVKLVNAEGTASFSGQITDIIEGRRGTEIVGDNLALEGIEIIDSSSKSSLIITSKGGEISGADLGGITGESLAKVIGKDINLTGNIELQGNLDLLMLNDISDNVTISTNMSSVKGTILKASDIGANVNIDIAGPISILQANSFVDGSLSAKGLGKIIISNGNFNVDCDAGYGDITSLIISGNITGGISAGDINMISTKSGYISGNISSKNNIGKILSNGDISGDISAEGTIQMLCTKSGDITGNIRAGEDISVVQGYNLNGALLSAGNNIGKAIFQGNIHSSYLLAGYDIGNDCQLGQTDENGSDSWGSGDILTLIAKGQFANSYLCAGTLPETSLTKAASLDLQLPFYSNSGSVKKVVFGNVDFYDASEKFGIYTATPVRPIKIGRDMIESEGFFEIDNIA